ncbi:MAG: NAD(P) transhydrogenase subunit alpha, partial [Pseudomonadota bacterium]
MKIGILYERRPNEKRVAASVESIKKLTQLGFDVCIEKSAGQRAGISDQDFQTAGATIAQTPQETCEGRDLIIKIQRPMDLNEGHDELSILPKNSFLLCHMDAKKHKEFVRELSARGIHAFALEMMPRITRAQSMDILSSQANIAGYKAVLDALEHYGRAMPMMMTPAGTVPPARVFIMGVGVAGLQAIATARRLGAIVSASDVRPATKEQVESLGAKFIAVEDEEFLQAQTSAGYAKEMSQGYQKKQAELIAKTVSNQDIIITTALIPGKPAPRLISSKMIETMKEGSVLIDMAVEAGGNIEGA